MVAVLRARTAGLLSITGAGGMWATTSGAMYTASCVPRMLSGRLKSSGQGSSRSLLAWRMSTNVRFTGAEVTVGACCFRLRIHGPLHLADRVLKTIQRAPDCLPLAGCEKNPMEKFSVGPRQPPLPEALCRFCAPTVPWVGHHRQYISRMPARALRHGAPQWCVCPLSP